MNDDMGKVCEIPYKKQIGIAATIILIVFGDGQRFPNWCVQTSHAIFLAVFLFWTVYAWVHNDRKHALKYLLISLFIIIAFAFLFFMLPRIFD